MELKLNELLVPGLSRELLEWPHRVLSIDSKEDLIWCISLPRVQDNGRIVPYMTAPKAFSLRRIVESLDSGEIKRAMFDTPGHWAMSDEDYLAEALNPKEAERRKGRLKARDEAWAIISPLVGDTPTQTLARQLQSLRPALVARAAECPVDITTVYRILHLYLANGSTRNGLIPETPRCGAPGKQRAQRTRLGRKPNRCKRGDAPEGYLLTGLDKERLARGYALAGPGKTRRQAYLLVSATFWGNDVVRPDGSSSVDLWEPHLRPTFDQFLYWGKLLGTPKHRKRRVGLDTSPTHHGGSSQDLACAVGQVAMLDSTASDVYLTSLFSRLRKLPPLKRTIVKELRSTCILGVYTGWDAPSPATALQAVLNGAEDKREFCARFGITIEPDEWPGMLCRTYLTDNGEMRAAEMLEAEQQMGFGIEFCATYSGSSKGDVESQHSTDHKRLDHRVPGTTRGKQRQRGEPHPADAALWNYYEYMRELIFHILDYNNQEVPALAPTEMKIAGIRPTRLNIFRWLRDHNQRADIPCNLDQLRALTLPKWPAVMQYNGIVPKTCEGSRNLPNLRFFSKALEKDARFQRARETRQVVPISVRFNPQDLGTIWLPTSRGLLRLPNVHADQKLQSEGTVEDLLDHMDLEAVRKDASVPVRDQADTDTVLRREGVTANAIDEQKAEAKSSKVSKARQRKDMRPNRAAEQVAIAGQSGAPQAPSATPPSGPQPAHHANAGSPTSSAEQVLDAFLAELSGAP